MRVLRDESMSVISDYGNSLMKSSLKRGSSNRRNQRKFKNKTSNKKVSRAKNKLIQKENKNFSCNFSETSADFSSSPYNTSKPPSKTTSPYQNSTYTYPLKAKDNFKRSKMTYTCNKSVKKTLNPLLRSKTTSISKARNKSELMYCLQFLI